MAADLKVGMRDGTDHHAALHRRGRLRPHRLRLEDREMTSVTHPPSRFAPARRNRSTSSAPACTPGANGAATSPSMASSPPEDRPGRGRPGLAANPIGRGRGHHPQRLPRLRRGGRPSPRSSAGTASPSAPATPPAPAGSQALQSPPAPKSSPASATSRSSSEQTPPPRAFFAPVGGERKQRSRLAALPPDRCHQPRLLRAAGAPPDGPLRRHRSMTSPRSRSRTPATAYRTRTPASARNLSPPRTSSPPPSCPTPCGCWTSAPRLTAPPR